MSNVKAQMSNTGFSLLELLVASGIFAVVSLVGFAALSNSQTIQARTAAQRAVGQNARFALETIAREVRLANGLIRFADQGGLIRQAAPFTILDGTVDPGDGRVRGMQLRVATTNLETRAAEFRTYELVEVVRPDGSSHRFVEALICRDPPVCLIRDRARVTGETIEVDRLTFRGLPGPADGSPPNRQPFLEIELVVRTPTGTGETETVRQTLQTLVTTRHYQF